MIEKNKPGEQLRLTLEGVAADFAPAALEELSPVSVSDLASRPFGPAQALAWLTICRAAEFDEADLATWAAASGWKANRLGDRAVWFEHEGWRILSLGCGTWRETLTLLDDPHQAADSTWPLWLRPNLIPTHVVAHGVRARLAWLICSKFGKAELVTFGAPRLVRRDDWNGTATRVVHGIDAMATVPPPGTQRHLGRHYLISEGGRWLIRPWSLLRTYLFVKQTTWLVELLEIGLRNGFLAAIAIVLEKTVSDHASRNYHRSLRAAVRG